MQRTLNILKASLFAAGTLLALFGCLLLFQASSAIQHADANLKAVTGQANDLLGQMQKTVLMSQKLMNDGRLTLDNVNKGAIDERMYFERDMPKMMAQAHAVLANVTTATADLHPLLAEVTARTHALEPIETNAAGLLADASRTVADPHIAASLVNIDAATASLAVTSSESAATMGSVKAIAADGQAEVHSMLHPKPLVSIANWTLKVVHAMGGWF
jgi:hypothetical protein